MRFKTGSLVQVLSFVVITGLFTAVVGATFAQLRIGEDSKTYKAVFSDASGLEKNVSVRGSGVSIGAVKDLERRKEGGVLVTFTVPKTLEVTESTRARIRYANLTGDRYLDLTPGTDAESAVAMPGGSTIPESRTQPALELDDLFAGFDPLMQALDPEQVNELSKNIIGVTEGEAGAYKSMLANVGEFTQNLSDRDELIGEVITEVNETLTTIDLRREKLDSLVVNLNDLAVGLNSNDMAVVEGLADLSELGTQVKDFVEPVRPGLKGNIDNLGTAAVELNKVEPFVRTTVENGAIGLSRAGRLASNGSMFNFFLCGVKLQVDVPGSTEENPVTLLTPPSVNASDSRCQKGTND